MNESCIALTEPFDADVVATAHSAELATPKRTSLPSMLPPGLVAVATWSAPSLVEHRVARALAARRPTTSSGTNMSVIAASSAQPCRVSPIILPNV